MGACLRFHPLYESVGEAALPGALICAGAEEVALVGRSFTVFRYEWRELGGGVRAVYRIAVDGRIVGFNFQWAWASGFVAGTSA